MSAGSFGAAFVYKASVLELVAYLFADADLIVAGGASGVKPGMFEARSGPVRLRGAFAVRLRCVRGAFAGGRCPWGDDGEWW